MLSIFCSSKKTEDINNINEFFINNHHVLKNSFLNDDVWVLENSEKIKLLEKIKLGKKSLGDTCDIFGGIKTGFDEAFVIDESLKQKLIALDKKSEEIIKPWFKGRDISKWFSKYDKYIIYIPQNKINIDDYPAIREHLLKYKEKLSSRATSQKWYELQQPQERFTKLFNGEKIIYSEIAKEMRALRDNTGAYGTMKMFFIPYHPIVLAVLNSNLFDWYARMTFSSLGDPWNGGRLEFKSMYMSKLPLPALVGETQDKIINLIENMKESEVGVDFENIVNDLVFTLYGVTEEEKEIIRNS